MSYKVDRTITEKEFTVVETALSTSFKDVYEYKIPAGQKVVIGAGKIIDGVDDREDFYMLLNDGTNNIGNYEVRIVKRDANNMTNLQQYRKLDADGDGVIQDKTGVGGGTGTEKITPDKILIEDQSIVVQVRLLSGTATINTANSKIRLPITIKPLR